MMGSDSGPSSTGEKTVSHEADLLLPYNENQLKYSDGVLQLKTVGGTSHHHFL